MPYQSTSLARLNTVLSVYAPGSSALIAPGTSAVASPSRLATEWQGYTVAGDSTCCYAKVLQADMAEVLNVAHSAQASQCAGVTGAAPRLINADTATGVLLFEALPVESWRTARLNDLIAPESLNKLWALKRAIHSGPSPGFVRSPMEDIDRLRALCSRDQVELPFGHAWINQCIDMAWDALQGRPFTLVPVHGDGVSSNVMISTEGELKLVDFDYGGCMDPWYDVAIALNELYPFENQWREGITAWAGQCLETDYAVCRLYALINDWYWTLWAFWAGTVSGRSLEFSKLGQWTFLRCQQGMQDPRLESWLRLVKRISA
jgi:aminoglycoside phosphotransferase